VRNPETLGEEEREEMREDNIGKRDSAKEMHSRREEATNGEGR